MLRRGDGVAAVATLLRAAALSAEGSGRGRRLAEAAYIGAEVTGALADVPALLARAREATGGVGDSLSCAVAAAHLLLNGDGDGDTAHGLLVGALENLTPAPPAGSVVADGRIVDEALHTLMLVCAFGGRPELWGPFHVAVTRLHHRLSPQIPLAAVTNADPARATPAILGQLDRILLDAREESDPGRIVQVAVASAFVDRLGACRLPLLKVVEDGRAGGAVASATYALPTLAFDAFQHGRWDEAADLADEGLALCERSGYPLMAWPGRYVHALLAAGRGRWDRLEELDAAMALWAVPRRALVVRTYLGHAQGLAALGRGDVENAYRRFAEISPPGTLAPHAPFALWTVMDLVEAAVRTGRDDDATAHVAAAGGAGIGAISPLLALQYAGAAAIAAGDHPEAPALFERALTMQLADPSPFTRARIELAYGERLRRDRRKTPARVHLGAALAVFDGLGAAPWAERARSELHAAGPARHSPGPARAETLTTQEHQIALLAASGLTNRQIGERLFLSHRTVGTHLYHLFPKLGITTRAGLRDALDVLG